MKCPESMEELVELEKALPLCKVTLYEQAKARKEKHPEKSERQIAGEIAEELEKEPGQIRMAIRRGEKEAGTTVPLNLTASDKTYIIREAKNIKTERRKQRETAREEQKAEIAKTDPPIEGARFKVLDPCTLADADIEPQSIDAIITDPPYGFDYIPLYEDLSRKAAEWLKPDAPCIVMIGQSWLELSLKLLSKHLNYIWTLAFFTPGSSVQVFGRRIKSNWKPIIYLVNGKNIGEHINDVIDVGSRDKSLHDWGQSVESMAQIVERFTVKNSVVLDPFCGSGTTGMACINLERYFIGIDLDEIAVKQSRIRLQEAENATRGSL